MFALWPRDQHYWAGTVHLKKDSKYQVVFDDEEKAFVGLEHLRAAWLLPGDRIVVDDKMHTVVDAAVLGGSDVRVKVKGPDGRVMRVSARNVCIGRTEIAKAWNERKLPAETVTCSVRG